MKCPKCLNGRTIVKNSRVEIDRVRRRRECLLCKQRFTTHEIVPQLKVPDHVRKLLSSTPTTPTEGS